MTTENLVQVTGLNRSFGSFHAVQDLHFALRRGEVLGFLGPNGAGKSTTMKMLCGALAPSSGEILIGGEDLVSRPRQAKRMLGYLPEHPPLYEELTVDEYLRYCARLRGVSDVGAAVEKVKARCGLEDVGRRLIRNLSKGFQQRAGIAQAVLHRPAVVILDEPTSGLDPIQIRAIRRLIRDLGGEHSVIVSTHILPEASTVCDRVLILDRGRLVLDEATAAVATRTGVVIVGLRRGPGPEALEQALHAMNRRIADDVAGDVSDRLTTIARVEALDHGYYRLRFDGELPPLEWLSRLASERDWGLFELRPLATSLEEVFMSLTCADEAVPQRALATLTADRAPLA